MRQTVTIAIASIFVGIAVLALKALAWWLTGSIALLSDALESIVNVATAVAALIAIRIAATPADAQHPYGHHKAEFFSAVLEGVLIVVAALLIFHSSATGFLHPKPLEAPISGVLVNIGASVINAVWCWVLISTGRRNASPALIADGKHLLTDVISSVGVTIGVVAAVYTGWPWLDPALAALVALNILWSGWQVIRSSVSGLMDESVPEEQLQSIRDVISAEAKGAQEVHDLRTRHAGRMTFVDFHLVVPGAMSVADAHDICDRIERAIKKKVHDVIITIHVEPENKAKHSGVVVL